MPKVNHAVGDVRPADMQTLLQTTTSTCLASLSHNPQPTSRQPNNLHPSHGSIVLLRLPLLGKDPRPITHHTHSLTRCSRQGSLLDHLTLHALAALKEDFHDVVRNGLPKSSLLANLGIVWP
jgi:hypothetical protein